MGHVGRHLERVGSYRVVRLLDEGPYSIVFRVRHEVLGTDHALKLAKPRAKTSIREAMLFGARLQARVHHPNVVRVTDAGSTPVDTAELPWFAMDWSPGGTLADWLDRGRVTPRLVRPIAKGLLRGLCALHDAGIVHRDLKPDNVLMVERGRKVVPRITDLNLAKEVEEGAAPAAAGLSMEFSTLGTPGYMAPEQFHDVGSVDHRADLFSVGCILYELLVGEPAFDDEDEMAIFARVGRGEYPPVSMVRPSAPRALAEMVEQLLQVDPGARPASAAEVLAAVSRA